jgi:lysophospholipase L1-like esterase
MMPMTMTTLIERPRKSIDDDDGSPFSHHKQSQQLEAMMTIDRKHSYHQHLIITIVGIIVFYCNDILSSLLTTTTNTRMAYSRPKLLLLGDSLTQLSFEGWGGDLANRYQRRADVLNRGMSGYNTRWFLRYADDNGIWTEPGNVVFVTIFFGANDAALQEQDPAKFVPIPEYKDNLHKLITKTQTSYPDARVLVITPPPVHKQQRLSFQKQRYGDKATGIPERTFDNTQKYAQACIEVAQETKVPYLDMFTAMVDEGGEDDGFGQYLCDGLHFNKVGHDFVFQKLLEAIENNFSGLVVTPDPNTGQANNCASKCLDLDNSGPYHDEIDYKDWAKAFVDNKSKKRKEPPSSSSS